MAHESVPRFVLDGFPRARDCQDKPPWAGRVGWVALWPHPPVGLGAIGGIPADQHALRPMRWPQRAHHLPEPGIGTVRCPGAFGQKQAKAHRHALALPGGQQPPEAPPAKPGRLLTETPLLHHGMLGPAFVGVPAISTPIPAPMGRWWPGGQASLRQPADPQRPMPGGGCEPTTKAPRGDRGGRPSGPLCQGVAARRHRLEETPPAEQAAMAPTPHGGYAAQHQRHKAWQRRAGDHHTQRGLQRRAREKSCRWQCSDRLDTLQL